MEGQVTSDEDEPEFIIIPSLINSLPLEVQLHPLMQYIRVPSYQGVVDGFQLGPMLSQLSSDASNCLRVKDAEMSKQIASYADQVKEMKGRINWLQESLRQNSRCRSSSAEEHAEDLSKFFAVQSMKVEELGQQIDVFSEELRQWEDADVSTSDPPDSRFSPLARAVIECDGLTEGSVENVRIQLSDLVKPVNRLEEASAACKRVSISAKDLEVKRKAMTKGNNAKRRKIQEVRLPFKVGVSGSGKRTDKCESGAARTQGVRTVQLRKNNSGSDNSGCINSLQRELLQLKELLEEREQELCEERRKRCEIEERHAVEVRAFLKEAEDRTEYLNHERALRAEAEDKVVYLEAQLRAAQEQSAEVTQAQEDDTEQALSLAEVKYEEEPSSELSTTEADVPFVSCSLTVSDGKEGQVSSAEAALGRFYGKELAMNAAQHRQALKLKSIAEAKVENLKKQVAALKKVNAELQNEQNSKLKKDNTAAEMEKLQAQLLHFKKLLAEKTRELEVEQVTRAEGENKAGFAISKLENEVLTYKKLALEKAADMKAERNHKLKAENLLKELKSQLDDTKGQPKTYGQLQSESQNHDAISHKQTRRLQSSLKKTRQKYEQLHELLRKEQEGRVAAETLCRKWRTVCGKQVVKLQELEMVLDHLLVEVETGYEQGSGKGKANDVKAADVKVKSCRGTRGGSPCLNAEESKVETSEKLLLLLDKLARGLDPEAKVWHEEESRDESERNTGHLVSQIREQVRNMANSLKVELSFCEQKGKVTTAFTADHESRTEQTDALRLGAVEGEEAELNETLQNVPVSLSPDQQVAHLRKMCEFQGKKLRAADAKIQTLRTQMARWKELADERNKELEAERACKAERKNDLAQLQKLKREKSAAESESLARLKVLEIQLLEYKRQAEEKAKDLKHERSLRFDIESKSAQEIEQLKQQVLVLVTRSVEARVCVAEVGVQVEDDEMQALETQVFVLELLVTEKCEALSQEREVRAEAEERSREVTQLLSYSQAQVEEISQVSACQGHKVMELTSLLEFFVSRLNEYQKYQVEMQGKLLAEQEDKTRLAAELHQEQADKVKLVAEMNAAAAGEDSLKKHVQHLELSEEVLRYRDKVWRRSLLAFDQLLLLCFAAMFAFNRMSIVLRDFVPT